MELLNLFFLSAATILFIRTVISEENSEPKP